VEVGVDPAGPAVLIEKNWAIAGSVGSKHRSKSGSLRILGSGSDVRWISAILVLLCSCSPWPSTIAVLLRGTVVPLSSCAHAFSQRSSPTSSRWNASSDRESPMFRIACSRRGDDPRPVRARVKRRESIARSQGTSCRRFASVLVLAGKMLGMATVPHMKDGARASFPR